MPIDREMLTEEKGVSMKMSEEVEIKELTKGPAKHRTPWAPFISRLMFSDLKDTYQRFVVVSFQAFCLLLFITAQSAKAAVPTIMGVKLGMDWNTAVIKAKKACENLSSCTVQQEGAIASGRSILIFRSDDKGLGCMSFFMHGFTQGHGVYWINVSYDCFHASTEATLTSLKQRFGATSDVQKIRKSTIQPTQTLALWSDQPLTIDNVAKDILLSKPGWMPDQSDKRFALAILIDDEFGTSVVRLITNVVDGALLRLATKREAERFDRQERESVEKLLSPL